MSLTKACGGDSVASRLTLVVRAGLAVGEDAMNEEREGP